MVPFDVRNKARMRSIIVYRFALFLLINFAEENIMSDYRALYRKWRPVDFDDVSGQKSITDILKYEVENDKISHAYLFCGSRGTGKTSCAKILAKAVNCHNPRNGNPCNECSACRSIDAGVATDVIEMDAASNNGVGNVRDMKDEIAFTPAELKYRVYIIDEVHMMSGSAFNALLKTLEEPPAYIVFILATTEFHKLPTTIVSRCQRFDFRRMTTEVIVERLKKISASEGIDLAEDGAAMIARVSEGGMRDAVSLLELCAGSRTKIDADLVFATVGRGNKDSAYGLIERLNSADYGAVYSCLADVVMKGGDLSVFWQELIDAYRDVLVVKNLPDSEKYLDLTDTEHARIQNIAKSYTMPKLLYHISVLESTLGDLQRAGESKRSVAEIALTRMCDPKLEGSIEALMVRIEELEKTVSRLKYSGAALSKNTEDQVIVKEASKDPVAVENNSLEAKGTSKDNKTSLPSEPVPYSLWGRVVSEIGRAKTSIQSPLSKAVALKCSEYSFLIKIDSFFVRIIGENPENLAIIKGAIAEAENTSADKITVKIAPKGSAEKPTLADELERALKN